VTSPAVEDTNWLEPDDLYLAGRDGCEVDRPIYQGDVFAGVNLPVLPKMPLAAGDVTMPATAHAVMVIPHPCQCYYGDKLRPSLTVAPIKKVDNYDNFGEARTGAKDKFALPDLLLPAGETWVQQTSVADLGKIVSIPSGWLVPSQRVACLSQKGLGLLAKRILGFQLRDKDTTLSSAMALIQAEWNESFLMQAWVRKNESLKGFTAWLREPRIIKGIGGDREVVPAEFRVGALDALLAEITGDAADPH